LSKGGEGSSGQEKENVLQEAGRQIQKLIRNKNETRAVLGGGGCGVQKSKNHTRRPLGRTIKGERYQNIDRG